MARELNRYWALFSVVWTTGIAYITAVIFYQSAIFSINPLGSSMWILGMLGVLTIGLYGVRKLTDRKRFKNSKPFPTRITIL
jgi:ferrous iron transport protein B